ncbi:hypothetical protein E5206_09595 [Arthrobacter sp. PAMC25564]|uniref:hypothetical protein n=1 Tax=Arthrobacter sp. PAMC25564 TaxID=2565366 RepID=UPI0010A20A46|nr:hypothetical protein [Arthrobacter sp. PAMC25564]QCB97156.1 hypothetical protein E5206_09595 [Arthrobacter sp. PAMC25564]
MQTSISEWLESNTGESKRQMALRVGQTPSTFNRNIDMPDVIIAVCRAYELNPVEALVEAGIITADDVMDFAESTALEADLEKISTDSLTARMHVQIDELGRRIQGNRPVPGQTAMWDLVPADPDYSNMSEADAKDYGLAAFKGEDNIGFDDLPHEP